MDYETTQSLYNDGGVIYLKTKATHNESPREQSMVKVWKCIYVNTVEVPKDSVSFYERNELMKVENFIDLHALHNPHPNN